MYKKFFRNLSKINIEKRKEIRYNEFIKGMAILLKGSR